MKSLFQAERRKESGVETGQQICVLQTCRRVINVGITKRVAEGDLAAGAPRTRVQHTDPEPPFLFGASIILLLRIRDEHEPEAYVQPAGSAARKL